MGAKTLIKQSFDYLLSNKDLLRNLRTYRRFADKQTKQFGTKTQTLTNKGKLLYEGIPKPVGSTVMSHGRMRSYAMIQALRGRAPVGQRLRLSDYKRGVKPKKKSGTSLKGVMIPGRQPRRIFRTPWEKADFEAGNVVRAQKRLNQIRFKQSGSFLN